MADLASLGIKIDSSQAKSAATDLGKLADAAANVEKTTSGVGAAGKEASRGISDAARSQRELNDAYNRGHDIGQRIKIGLIAVAAAATAAAGAIAVGAIFLINQVGAFQDLGEKIGDTARNVSSLKEASDVSGVSIDSVAQASIRLTAALSKTDDESKAVLKGLAALGIKFEDFKKQSPVEQIETISRSLAGFADGPEKSAAALAIFGRAGAEVLPFMKEYADKGRDGAFVTAEQAKAADDFADSSTRLKSQITQFLQVLSIQGLPILTALVGAFKDTIAEISKIDAASAGLQANNAIALFAESSGRAIAGFTDFLIQSGRELATLIDFLGSYATITGQLLTLDLSGAKQTGAEFRERRGFDAKGFAVAGDQAATSFLSRFDARMAAIRSPFAVLGEVSTRAGLPKINTKGLNLDKDKKDNTAAQEAKARLQADLSDIRAASDALINTIGNSEKVLEARRAANLISEAAYYEEKRGFIQINDAIQESALEREIDRLQRENLVGKDRIDNERKIIEAQAKLAKVREDAATSIETLGIKEQAALKKTEDGFIDARIAAESYLESIRRAQQLELEGIGRGDKTRNLDAARAQIQQRAEQQRQDIAGELRRGEITKQSHDRQLALIEEFQSKALASYEDYYATLTLKQADFTNGAAEALANYLDAAKNLAKQTEEVTSRALGGIEDAFVSLAITGKADFKSLANSIIADIIRIQVRAQIAGLIAGFSTGGSFSTNGTGTSLPTSGGRAGGGSVGAGRLYEVNERGSPELLSVGGRQYLMMGQQSGNVTPVGASGTGASGPQFNLQIHNAPAGAVVQRRQNSSGGLDVDVMFEGFRDRMADDVQNGGKFGQTLQNQFGVNRAQGLTR